MWCSLEHIHFPHVHKLPRISISVTDVGFDYTDSVFYYTP
jgi:hypothetical protein